MKGFFKLLVVVLAVTGLLFTGASCKSIRKQVAEKVAQEATKKVVSPEGCDVAMAQNMTEEDQEAFKQKLDPILEEVRNSEDPMATFDSKKDAFRALFEEYVKKHKLDPKCTDMLNDKFMKATKEQVESQL